MQCEACCCVWYCRHGAEAVFEEYKRALREMGTPYIDALILEWAGSVHTTGEGLEIAR